MSDFQQLWKPHAIKPDETLDLQFGSLRLWIHRGEKEWHIAHETAFENDGGFSISIAEAPFPSERVWTRWILEEKTGRILLKPQLPDRPLIVRPEMPMCLMPNQSVRFFVGIPVWLAISVGSKHEQVVEIPSMTLSNSWFGPVTEGELCYAMKTTAKLNQQDLLPSIHRAVFPLEVRNVSREKLNFERLCLRPQYLNIFQGKTRLWTSKGRVSYRGEDNWSRIVYSSQAPEFDQADLMLGKARETMPRGVLLKTFDNLKQRIEL